jgi:hypothetical protein
MMPLLNGAGMNYHRKTTNMPRLRRSALVNPSEVLFLAADSLHVRQILAATGGQFVPYQQFLADDPHRQVIEVRCDFSFPRFLE